MARPASFQPEKQQNMSKSTPSRHSLTDWERLDGLTDEEIDFSDLPEVPTNMFAKGVVRRKSKISDVQSEPVPIDSDVLAWFRTQGREYQLTINRLLRAYMESQEASKVTV